MGTPGGHEEEEKKRANPEEAWAQMAEQELPNFGGSTRRTPLPPLPDAEYPEHRSEHSASRMDTKQADEEPLDWRNYVNASDPGRELSIRDVLPGRQPEAPNAHQGRMDQTIRDMSWMAYGNAAQHVDSMQRSIAPDYATFMDGQKNADLLALGFVVPGDFKGDADAFANKQNVSGGTSMASLFNKDGSLNTTTKDKAGMATAQKAFEKHGSGKGAHDMTVAADHELKEVMYSFEEARDGVKEAAKDVEIAGDEIKRVNLSHLVDDDKKKLEEAKEHAEAVKQSLEFVFGGALKYVVAGPEEAVDAMEGIGAMASYAVSKLSDKSIAAAQVRLEKHTEQLHDVEGEKARAELEKAQIKVSRAMKNLQSKRQAVLKVMGKRKAAYEQAGHASAAASGGDGGTKAKLTAFMAAIPAAEAMVGIVRNLAAKCSDPGPRYTSQAGVGFSMAVYAQSPQATNMVSTLGNIASMKTRFTHLLHDWETRLGSLQNARTQLGGMRPETDEDLAASVEDRKPEKTESK